MISTKNKKRIITAIATIVAMAVAFAIYYNYFALYSFKTKYKFDDKKTISFSDVIFTDVIKEVVYFDPLIKEEEKDVFEILESTTYRCLSKFEGKKLKGYDASEIKDNHSCIVVMTGNEKKYRATYIYFENTENRYVLFSDYRDIKETALRKVYYNEQYFTYYVPEDQEKFKALERFYELKRNFMKSRGIL